MAPYSSGSDATAWLAAIVESSDDAIVSKDLNGIVTSWNLAAERIFGYPAHEIIGQPILKLIPPERHSEEDYILGQVRRGESIKQYDTQRRCKDGRLIHVSLTVSPIRNQSNVIVGVSKIARDITERKLAHETQTPLLRELNHRSENLLAVADAIVRQTAKSTSPREFVERMSGRLHALSINQDLMIEHDWRGSRHHAGHSMATGFDHRRLHEPGDRGRLSLCRDAARRTGFGAGHLRARHQRPQKFGALSSTAGKIHIKWQVTERNGTREFNLSWRESGGPAVVRPRKKRFGSAITESMVARSVTGSVAVTYDPAGLIWELVAPEAGLTETAGSLARLLSFSWAFERKAAHERCSSLKYMKIKDFWILELESHLAQSLRIQRSTLFYYRWERIPPLPHFVFWAPVRALPNKKSDRPLRGSDDAVGFRRDGILPQRKSDRCGTARRCLPPVPFPLFDRE